jgi:hypothetical protein
MTWVRRAGFVTCVLVLGAAGVVSLAPRAALAGDAKIAETLLKTGKQAFQKGDFAGAVPFFQKAYDECPDLLEALWWRAAAQEKAGDKPTALASYREFLACFEGKVPKGVSKEEQRLKGLADKAVDALAAGEKEFRKLEDAHVAWLLQFAKDQFVRDPGVALKALGHLLAVRPDHEDALKLQEKLGGAPAPAGGTAAGGPAPAVGPFKDVKEWRDLLQEKPYKTKLVSYGDGTMTLDTTGGSLLTPSEFLDAGSRFAYEMDVRFPETYDRGWLSGLTFAKKESGFVAAILESGKVTLFAKANEGQTDLAKFDMPPIDPAKWHRLGVVVDGPAVAVWFDGKQVATWTNPTGADLVGELGIFQQRCRTERRVFRFGKLGG